MTTGPTGLYASFKVAPGLLAYGQLLYEKKLKKWSDSMGSLYNLIAATTDNSTGIRWNKSDGDYVQTGAYSDNDGLSNTTQIVSTQGAPITNYAAGLCQSYTGGGYHDWFLPAKNQLNCLYQNSTAIGNFDTAGYWSSTQSPTGLYDGAWFQAFYGTGFQGLASTNIATVHIRCVRNLAP